MSSSAVLPAETQLSVLVAIRSAASSVSPAHTLAVPIWKVDVPPTLSARKAITVSMAAAPAAAPALVMVVPNS